MTNESYHAAPEIQADNITAAMAYADRGIPVFPCRSTKRPYTAHGFHDASTDPVQITAWWTQWPGAFASVSGKFEKECPNDNP